MSERIMRSTWSRTVLSTLLAVAAALTVACGAGEYDAESGDGLQATVELKPVVQGMYDAFARGDVESVVALMAADIEWNEAENFPYADGNPYIGPEAVVNGIFVRLGEEWDYWHVTPEKMMEDGDNVVAFGRYTAQHKETGKAIDAQFVHVWTVVDGKATRFQQYADTAQVTDAMKSDAS